VNRLSKARHRNAQTVPLSATAKKFVKESVDRKWQAWYETFDETHSPQQRQEWYSQAATAYRWARPQYPPAMVDSVITQANLRANSSLLEIGCGPGIATAAFAAKGFSIVGVEPSLAACKLAHKSCGYSDRISIVNSTFENYPLPANKFDAVLAATSFHWVAPAVACQKSAAALAPGGSLILLWATPPQPSVELGDYLQPIYNRYDLAELGEQQCKTQAYYQGNFEAFAQRINQSGLFQPASVALEQHSSTYSIEKYLALLSTLSPYIDLDPTVQDNLLTELEQALAERLETGAFEATHWFAVQVSTLLCPGPSA